MVVLDASAILAVLKNEPGHDKILYQLEEAATSAISYCESLGFFTRHGMDIDQANEIVSKIQLEIIDFNEVQAAATAELLPLTKPYGLSLADRACLALGISKKATILTADRAWKTLKIKGAKIEVIR